MTIPLGLYIKGKWIRRTKGRMLTITNPATESKLYSIPYARKQDIDNALIAAEEGFAEWRKTDPWSRCQTIRRIAGLIRKRRKIIACAMTEEQGKPVAESLGEVDGAADFFDWQADEARRIYGRTIKGHTSTQRIQVNYQPIGVVAAFSPWNFPCLLSARKIAPALAAGCSMIIKPAKEAPRPTFALAQACEDAGVPPGVVNVLCGDSSFISKQLIASDSIRKVSFTGSVPIGEEIYRLCAAGIKTISLELGGHGPVLVFDDVDAKETAKACVFGKFRNNGQVCISPSRFFVQETIYNSFIEHFVEQTKKLKIGNGLNKKTDLGPLANKRRLKAVQDFINDAREKGARVLCGGKRSKKFSKGYYFEPTVLTDVHDKMTIMSCEPFSPVAPITPFSTLEDGLAQANKTEYGLAGYLFTRDLKTAHIASEGLEVGMVGVNTFKIAAADIPFGGIKKSGIGREGGSEGIREYLTTRYVSIQL